MLSRAHQLIPQRVRAPTPALCIAVATGPMQTLIRPADLDSPQFADQLTRAALMGSAPICTTRQRTTNSQEGQALVLHQIDASVLLDGHGSMRIILAARSQDLAWPPAGVAAIIHEEIQEHVERALRFAAEILAQVDPAHSITHVAPVVAVLDAGYLPWRTRAEHTASPNSAQMPAFGRDPVIAVQLSPAIRERASLGHDAADIAQDLTALLRRRMVTR